MEEFIIGTLVSLGLGFAERWRHWRKVRRAAELVVNASPNTSPRKALEQALIRENFNHLSRQVDVLVKRQAEAKQRELEAIERGRELGEGFDVTIVERDGSEEFRSWKDGER